MEITPEREVVAKLFRHKVLRLLQEEEGIDEQVVAILLASPRAGFGAYGSRGIPADAHSRENIARYLAHSPAGAFQLPDATTIRLTGAIRYRYLC